MHLAGNEELAAAPSPAEASSRPARTVLAGVTEAAGRLASRLRPGESDAVARSPRFRAVQRRRTRAAARAGFLVIAAAAAFDGVVQVDRDPAAGPILLALNGGVVVLAVLGWWCLARRLRRHPDPVAATVTLALAAVTGATGLLIPALAVETVGYLILIPGLVALILPWSTRSHVRWLAADGALSLGFLVIAPAEGLSAEIRGDLVVVLLVAIGASLAGHVLLQRAQIRNFSQLQKIQALHRRADADMAELARVHRELEETARTDPLTGAGNRIRLGEDLRTVRARMGRLQQSHGIVAVDLDRFKVINDRLGHLAGDEILRQVVATIRQTIRAEDAVYRFGGEEFLVIIRVPDRPSLLVATERLRVAVVARQLRHPDNGVNDVVTISMGAVLVTPDDLAQSDDEWFARADEALYRAKANGRNRVEFATT